MRRLRARLPSAAGRLASAATTDRAHTHAQSVVVVELNPLVPVQASFLSAVGQGRVDEGEEPLEDATVREVLRVPRHHVGRLLIRVDVSVAHCVKERASISSLV